MKLKKMKKKKELTALYKGKKITGEQYVNGLKKLGYAADVEKAMAFKKYIQNQIEAFETMEVAPAGMEGQSHFDPNGSRSDLPRDESGNVITDFSVTPTAATATKHQTAPEVMTHTHEAPSMRDDRGPSSGPLFGESLFSSSGGPGPDRRMEKKEVPKGGHVKEVKAPVKRAGRRSISTDLEWDDDDDVFDPLKYQKEAQDEEFVIDLEEDEFVIDLEEEEIEGESGWWDDDEWELEWNDEDEEEWEDWDLDVDDDEWDAIWDDDLDESEDSSDLGGGVREGDEDEFVIDEREEEEEEEDEDEGEDNDEDDEDEEDEFEDEDEDEEDEDEFVIDESEDEEDEDDDRDWGASRRRRRRNSRF
ncbi:MAG: hypothetical protein U9R75_05330 [Candidatus Thermoplasmatota archaeon]|nr:hypothetical protein [Candidatus Thermoplasmatota archaeon]